MGLASHSSVQPKVNWSTEEEEAEKDAVLS